MHVRQQRGLVRTVAGHYPAPVGVTDPEVASAAFLRAFATELGISDPATDLALRTVEDDAGGAVVLYDRLVAGVPVFRGEIRVHLDPQRAVRFVSAALPSDPAGVTAVPVLDEIAAVAAARSVVPADALALDATLVVFDEGILTGARSPARLSWWVRWRARRAASLPAVVVDASDGSVLWREDEVRSARVFTYGAGHEADTERLFGRVTPASGEAWPGAACGGPACEPDDPVEGCCGSSVLLWDDDATEPVPGTMPTQQAIDLHPAARLARTFFEQLGRDGWDGRGGAYHVLVNYGAPTLNNSYWDPHYDAILVGDGLASPDLLVHEMSHGLTHGGLAGLGPADEPGALDESFADVFAALAGEDWILHGPGGAVVRDLRATASRDIADTTLDLRRRPAGHAPSEANDQGFVHYNSGLPSRVADLLVHGGPHWTTRVEVARIGDDASDLAVGRERFAQIWLRAATLYLTPSSTFEDAAYQIVAACVSLAHWPGGHPSGVTLRDCGSVLQAFHAVGVTPYDTDRDTWSDEVDDCPRDEDFEQLDEDHDGVGDACERTEERPDAAVSAPASFPCPATMPTREEGTWPLGEEIVAWDRPPYHQYICRYSRPAGAHPWTGETEGFAIWWTTAEDEVYPGCGWPPPNPEEDFPSDTHKTYVTHGFVGHEPLVFQEDLRAFADELLSISEAGVDSRGRAVQPAPAWMCR